MKNKILLLVLLNWFSFTTQGQDLGEGRIRWSPNHKLQLTDFKIHAGSKSLDPIYSQFTISTNAIRGLDFLKRNFNQKVENIFLGNASWIDTTNIQMLEKQLEFQQIQFDLSEVHARKYRKKIFLNRKKLASGGDFLNEIFDDLMIEFSKKKLELYEQTNSGQDEDKILEWKTKIQIELDELSDFGYDNTKKLKKAGD
ncbi:MAG: hypothetical protein AAGJ18_14980 [Bacteroidota bacterium]